MPIPTSLTAKQTAGLIRNAVRLKAHAMGVIIRDVPIDALSVANETYRHRMESKTKIPAKYGKAQRQAEVLAAQAGYATVLAAVRDVCDASIISPQYLEWMSKDARGYSSPSTCRVVLAFRQTYDAPSRSYKSTVVGCAFYGKLQGIEPADSESGDHDRKITFVSGLQGAPAVSAAQLNTAVTDRKAAIIEVLCRRQSTESRGVGALLVQYAIGRGMAYTHPGGIVFSNLVRSSQYCGQAPREDQYQAAPVLRGLGFRHIRTVRFQAETAGAAASANEVDVGRWYALGGANWPATLLTEITRELDGLLELCPSVPGIRDALTRC